MYVDYFLEMLRHVPWLFKCEKLNTRMFSVYLVYAEKEAELQHAVTSPMCPYHDKGRGHSKVYSKEECIINTF